MGKNNYMASYGGRMMSGDESTGTQPTMKEKMAGYRGEDGRLWRRKKGKYGENG